MEVNRVPQQTALPSRGSGSASLRERVARAVARPFFALMVLLARALPPRVVTGASVWASRQVFRLFPGIRRGLLENAGHILGPGSTQKGRRALALGVLESFARFLTELVAPEKSAPTQDLHRQTEGRDHFEAATAPGRGIIATTLHMGNYELASMELASLRENVSIVYNRERIAFLERLRSSRRRHKRLGEIVIDGSRFFGIEALRILGENGIVLLSADQVESRSGERFSFLHGTATFSPWPVRLSLASGAPILPAFNVREADGSYRLQLESPIFPRPDGDVRAQLEELVRVLERRVQSHPEQWLMIRPFWISDPP